LGQTVVMSRMARLIWLPLTVATVLVSATSCSASTDNLHVDCPTLLIYPVTSNSTDAALTGILSTNAAGCLAVGTDVLVAPSGSSLESDGSIVVSGTRYKFGSTVHIGGGGDEPRGGGFCGKYLQYFY
jgi:hypothetical protein